MPSIKNDIAYHRYVKQISRFGITRSDAKEIVGTAFSAGQGRDVDMYIEYAITLKYGFTPSKDMITI